MIVTLRPVETSDLEPFYEQQADPASVAMAAVPAREREDHFRHWDEVLADADTNVRAILVDGEVGGHIVSFLRDGKGEREVGYWLDRSLWGRGVATAALRAFLDDEEPRRPLVAHTAAHNPGSGRVLAKCGFRAVAEVHDPLRDGVDEVHWRLD